MLCYIFKRMATGLDMYSKTVSIADKYDAKTSSVVYRRTALLPDRVLITLIENSGKKVDLY